MDDDRRARWAHVIAAVVLGAIVLVMGILVTLATLPENYF